MKKNARDKDTRTGHYLRGTSPSQGFDGSITYPTVPSPPGRSFVPRLTFMGTPKLEYDSEEFCRGVEDAPEDVLFFCDTNVFHRSTDQRLWKALLNRGGKMVIVPPVRKELEPWLGTNESHVAARAILDEEPPVRFLNLEPGNERECATCEYYVNLLGNRKRLVAVERAKFEEGHGRAPGKEDLRDLMQELHKNLGPRGYMLAKKGGEKEGSPNFYTDEILVYLAMKTGIETGREVVILTKDEDLQEQFYKLQWLLDTHYRGMLFADMYAADPSRFVTHPMPMNTPDLGEMFVGNDNVLVERPDGLIRGDTAPILPPYCRPVTVHCWIVGERTSHMVFCAEQEMERLLHTKAITGGLNTYKFGEKNCHLWLAPLQIPKPLRGCAAIAQDRRVESGLVQTPLFDANQAIYTGERFMHATAS